MRAKLPDMDLETARRVLPPGIIDRPPTTESLLHWQEFLGGLEKFWQGNLVIQREVSFAKKVIAWKKGDEKGSAPKLEVLRLTEISPASA